MKLQRRYASTGGDCEHCRSGWRLYQCPLCPAAVCENCARQALGLTRLYFDREQATNTNPGLLPLRLLLPLPNPVEDRRMAYRVAWALNEGQEP